MVKIIGLYQTGSAKGVLVRANAKDWGRDLHPSVSLITQLICSTYEPPIHIQLNRCSLCRISNGQGVFKVRMLLQPKVSVLQWVIDYQCWIWCGKDGVTISVNLASVTRCI